MAQDPVRPDVARQQFLAQADATRRQPEQDKEPRTEANTLMATVIKELLGCLIRLKSITGDVMHHNRANSGIVSVESRGIGIGRDQRFERQERVVARADKRESSE